MTIRLGVVMDPIAGLNYKKDSTLALLWAAQDRGWELHYLEQQDLFLRDGNARANTRALRVHRDAKPVLSRPADRAMLENYKQCRGVVSGLAK